MSFSNPDQRHLAFVAWQASPVPPLLGYFYPQLRFNSVVKPYAMRGGVLTSSLLMIGSSPFPPKSNVSWMLTLAAVDARVKVFNLDK